MRKALLLIAGLACAGTAAAQYKWVDQNGKIQYGDTPPVGARRSTVRPSPAPRTEATQDEAADEAKKDETRKDESKKDRAPATMAEKEADFRKRRLDADKEREKQAQAQQEADQKRDNCARARENMRVLESGRVARVDAKGERYYLDDGQLAQEMVRARQIVREWCS